ncbi:AAA family ATPase, partial [Campylobacter hyointestinalis]
MKKGGSGKSTLATNIAINQSLSKNELPLLIDTDPQKSIATFLNIRNEE